MNAVQIAQVANFLNVSPNQIKRCEEWASVLFVQVHGFRPRFVSKKVVKVEIDSRIPQTLEEARLLSGMRFHQWNEEIRALCQEYMNSEVRKDGVVLNSNPATAKLRQFEDCRVLLAVAEIAAKLV